MRARPAMVVGVLVVLVVARGADVRFSQALVADVADWRYLPSARRSPCLNVSLRFLYTLPVFERSELPTCPRFRPLFLPNRVPSSSGLASCVQSSRRLPTSGNMAVQTVKSLCRSVSEDYGPYVGCANALCTQMKGYPDRIQACTTTHFEGAIAVINPEDSWVARWQRTCK